MDIQQALGSLQALGDKCLSAGVFKTMGDVLAFKESVDALVATLNEQHAELKTLKAIQAEGPKANT